MHTTDSRFLMSIVDSIEEREKEKLNLDTAEEVRFETVVLVCMAAGLKCRSQVTGQITGQVTGHTHKK